MRLKPQTSIHWKTPFTLRQQRKRGYFFNPLLLARDQTTNTAAMTSSFQYCFLRGTLSISWFPDKQLYAPNAQLSSRISIHVDKSRSVMKHRIWHPDIKQIHEYIVHSLSCLHQTCIFLLFIQIYKQHAAVVL